MRLPVLLLVPFVGSIATGLLPTRARTVLAGIAGGVSAVAAVWVISLFPKVRDGGVVRETVSWVPSLGLELTLRIDGFAWMFAVLVTVIGALVSLYARYYMSPEDPVARFYAFFLAFMGAMLGVVISGNLVQLVVFWELTSLVSFLLIGYWYHRRDAQRGARMALIVTGAGGLALLGGVVLLGHIVGSYELDAVLVAGARALSYALLTRPAPHSISPFFLDRALPDGGGTNVVNVMLVDFRAFDTIGEITVLGTVAMTVYALLRRFRPPPEAREQPDQQRLLAPDVITDLVKPRSAEDAPRGYMMVPSIIARLLLPVSIVVAAHFLLRGHNAPGGGFVAGLIVAIAMLTQYMVAGTRWTERNARVRPPRWIAVGLLLAAVTGLGAVAAGYPFLTTHAVHATLPLIGDVHIPSATFFDFGVFSVVIGATLLILTALAHQSIRAHRQAEAQRSTPPKAEE